MGNREDRKLLNVMKDFICNVTQRRVNFLTNYFLSVEFYLSLLARKFQTVVWVSDNFKQTSLCQISLVIRSKVNIVMV